MFRSSSTPLIISIAIDDIQTEELCIFEANEVDGKMDEFFTTYGIASPIVQAKIKTRILVAVNNMSKPKRIPANRVPSFSDPDVEYQINPQTSYESNTNNQTVVCRRLLSELNSANNSKISGTFNHRPAYYDDGVGSEYLESNRQSMVFNHETSFSNKSSVKIDAFQNTIVDKDDFRSDKYLLSEVFNEGNKRTQKRLSRTKMNDLRTKRQQNTGFNPQYEYQINQSNALMRVEDQFESSTRSSKLRKRYSNFVKENVVPNNHEEVSTRSSNLHGSRRASKMQTPLWTYNRNIEACEPKIMDSHNEYSIEQSQLSDHQYHSVQGAQLPSHHRSVSEHKQFNFSREKNQTQSRTTETRSKSFPKVFDIKAVAEIFNLLDEKRLGFLTGSNFGLGNLTGEDLKFLEPVILRVMTSSRTKKFRFSEFDKLCRNLCN